MCQSKPVAGVRVDLHCPSTILSWRQQLQTQRCKSHDHTFDEKHAIGPEVLPLPRMPWAASTCAMCTAVKDGSFLMSASPWPFPDDHICKVPRCPLRRRLQQLPTAKGFERPSRSRSHYLSNPLARGKPASVLACSGVVASSLQCPGQQ